MDVVCTRGGCGKFVMLYTPSKAFFVADLAQAVVIPEWHLAYLLLEPRLLHPSLTRPDGVIQHRVSRLTSDTVPLRCRVMPGRLTKVLYGCRTPYCTYIW